MALHAFLLSGPEAVALLGAANEITKAEVHRVMTDAVAENPMIGLAAKVTRLLGEVHLRQFFRVIGHFFQFTQAGVAFDAFCRVRNERYIYGTQEDISITTLSIPPSRMKEVSQLLRSIDVLASYLIALTRGMKRTDVQEIFCGFNPKSFVIAATLRVRQDVHECRLDGRRQRERLPLEPNG